MRSSRSWRLLVVCGTALVISASVGVTSAFAGAVNAYFSPANQGLKWSGSIKVFKNGGSEKTCTFPSTAVSNAEEGLFYFFNMSLSCTGGTHLFWEPNGGAEYENVYRLSGVDLSTGFHESPWGLWHGEELVIPWTNGSGSTQSTLNFNKTRLGTTSDGYSVTATGTVTATTYNGGLITLFH